MFFARKKRDAALKETIDRLGAVRDALRVLRVREEALLKELDLYRPGDYVRAQEYELEVRRKTSKRFDPGKLPKVVRDDRRYWVQETKTIFTFVPLDPSQKTPTADQISDVYAETHDLPIGLSPDEATYGEKGMPASHPAPAQPLVPDETKETPHPHDMALDPLKPLQAAEAAPGFDFSGVPRYRTGEKARKEPSRPAST